jgi:hypothetical protein
MLWCRNRRVEAPAQSVGVNHAIHHRYQAPNLHELCSAHPARRSRWHLAAHALCLLSGLSRQVGPRGTVMNVNDILNGDACDQCGESELCECPEND